ncbi:dual specificity protein phosphatase 22-A [Pristis pectinata]|uniref:dual specificity protein phosphatase 22-A n=1 Tax=Pristis pectinata TaxID=685728 RepID=UPI00223CC785|nr:dual specificity protein phosphatase 22-A [Pristis pectinata]
MGTGMSKILDGLYLGNIRDSQDKDNLVKNGVTHILSICNNAKPVLEDMKYLCIPASDSSNQNLIQYFKECIKFIHESRIHGGGCIVHCLAGVSRSTTMVVAYLMTVTDYSWEECLFAVKSVRSYASPNISFQQQLQEFDATLVKEYRRWLQTEYGENRFNDKQEIGKLVSQYNEKQKQQHPRYAEQQGTDQSANVYPLPYKAYGSSSHDWANR